MCYATAIWNYVTDDGALPTLIAEFADFGYDTISFTTALLDRLSDEQLHHVAATVTARGLMVTVHGNFELGLAEVARCLEPFADRLLCVTCDAALCSPPDQSRYDAARMAPFLRELLALTAGGAHAWPSRTSPWSAASWRRIVRTSRPCLTTRAMASWWTWVTSTSA